MIPCFICGQNAETGWVQGFPPAPDSQKLGLCPQHNTRENRNKVQDAWQEFMRSSIGMHTRNEAFKTAGTPRVLHIFFVGGGSISVPCMDFSTPDPNLLKVITPEGEAVFFPLRQVLRYSIAPVTTAATNGVFFEKAPAHATTDAEIITDPKLPPGRLKSLAPGSGRHAPELSTKESAPAELESALRKLPPKVFSAEALPVKNLNAKTSVQSAASSVVTAPATGNTNAQDATETQAITDTKAQGTTDAQVFTDAQSTAGPKTDPETMQNNSADEAPENGIPESGVKDGTAPDGSIPEPRDTTAAEHAEAPKAAESAPDMIQGDENPKVKGGNPEVEQMQPEN